MSPYSLTLEGFSRWANQFPLLSNSITFAAVLLGSFTLAAMIKYRFMRPRKPVISGPIFDISQLPLPTWIVSATGELLSSNRDIPVPNDSSERLVIFENGNELNYTTRTLTGKEQSVTIAIPCDELVALEKSNKRLMETLSTTFAKLPVGLAIFDVDKTLTHFNPAITNLLDLDPTWLVKRPTIVSVLEKLRENRHLPDHKDFLEWRRLLVDIQSTSKSKSYSDVWALPNGNNLLVSGEAHSEGAVTFLFEDITAQIAIERRHFAETALNQAVIDHILDPMVVINPAGSIVSVNNAFEELFNYQNSSFICDATISSLANDFPVAAEFWTQLETFVSQSVDRNSWSLPVNLDAARTADVHPMPDGSTLVFLRLKWVSPHALPVETIALSASGG